MKMTKKGAQNVTVALDKIAGLFQAEWETLGIDKEAAEKFVQHVDHMADTVAKKAGLLDEQKTAADWPPSDIGREVAGPQDGDSDEGYMKGEFSQQENRELREMQEAGSLSGVNTDPQSPSPGKQATFDALGRMEAGHRVGAAIQKLKDAAAEFSKDPVQKEFIATPLAKLAFALSTVQEGITAGSVDGAMTNRALKAAGEVLPHLGVETAELQKLATAAKLATDVIGSVALADGGRIEDKPDGGRQAEDDHGFNLNAA